ncbi:MAG: cytochrome c oxidase accessory protein CcoG [Ferruginibacter sp.]
MDQSTSIAKPSLDNSYRDSVATITTEGKRNYIHPKKPKGKLYRLRTIFSIVYLCLFFSIPFIKIHGEPLLLLNVLERKFIIFGLVFWPQDFFIFGIAMLTFVVFIVLFTVVFGRVFCGWACPQTIFMEMVFRKVEYWIDGDSTKQKQLAAMPWNRFKIIKRAQKFILFFLLSFLIANFFLAYLVGMDNLLQYISHPSSNISTLSALLIFTTIFFFVYWWFREQVCIVVCPYGRLQGVLLDKNSIVVAYDHKRGEPRSKMKKKNDHDCKCTDCDGDGACNSISKRFEEMVKQGDCIDCMACVRVCPTGIDIRNGTQLECINCTACIDACDHIMESVHKPNGLIRFASDNSINKGKKIKFNTRIKSYSAVLFLLISLLVFLLLSRTDLDATLMRVSGMTFQREPDGRISNLYNLKLANKTHDNISVSVKLENLKGEIKIVGSSNLTVNKEDYNSLEFFVKLNDAEIKSWKTKLQIGLYNSKTNKKIKSLTANFMGPEIYN